MVGKREDETMRDALAHYGVKGMRWGVRKKDDAAVGNDRSGSKPKDVTEEDFSSAVSKFYATKSAAELKIEGQKKLDAQAADPGFPSKRQAKAVEVQKLADDYGKGADELREAIENTKPGVRGAFSRNAYKSELKRTEKTQEQLNKKAEQLREGKLTSNQKKALVGLGAAAAVAGLAYYGNRKVGELRSKNFQENKRETNKQWNDLFGKDYPSSSMLGSTESPGDFFYSGLTNKKAFLRPEFTIPEGTVFQRLTNHPEDSTQYGKVKGAYATFLKNDKKIYGASGEFGHKKYNVNFKAEGPVRVPRLNTVYSHLKQIQRNEFPNTPEMWSDDRIATLYHQMAGGSWSDSTAIRLFDSLRSHGYSAIVDDMDAGYLGDLPIVFFGKAQAPEVTERSISDIGNDKAGMLKLGRAYA